MQNKIAKFHKVSQQEYISAMRGIGALITDDKIKEIWDEIKLPKRATVGSCGYDIFAPFSFSLKDGEELMIPTGIRCEMEPGWALLIHSRSGLGTKHYLRMANCTGLIDGDYFHADNEGHFYAKVRNESGNPKNVAKIVRGQAFVQGCFMPFGITVDDYTTGIRTGGHGHSDEKMADIEEMELERFHE